jgi:DNA-binding LacI/PurR family transcriptional regulator/DNA-binding transcriptional regulator YhcF (GntR family)
MQIQVGEKPKYLQLVEQVRQQIDAGELRPGDRLPSYAEMRKKYGLTQPTIDRGHTILEKEGYIERIGRKGTFVSIPGTNKNRATIDNILHRSVVVLAGGATQSWPHHQQTGWAEYITLGAINELRSGSRNVISLDPGNLQQSDIEYFLQRPPAGAIVIGEPVITDLMLQAAQQLQKAGVPVVVYGNGPQLRQFDRVISDHEQGNYELTKWLIGQGCQRILQVHPGSIEPLYWLEMRDQGYRRAMRESALPAYPPCFYPTWTLAGNDAEQFERAARLMAEHLAPYLTGEGNVEALMAVTDGEVYVLAAACRLLGKEPNKDVLLVGYDHYWEDSHERKMESVVPLATIDKRNPELGASLVQLLNERIANQVNGIPHCRALAPRIIVH